jgi:hypothetical protein
MDECQRYTEEDMIDYLDARFDRERAASLACHCSHCSSCDKTLRWADEWLRVTWPERDSLQLTDILQRPTTNSENLPQSESYHWD